MTLQVSVIIPAYNAAATIADAVHSAFAQTLLPFEVVVIDDGSVDATAEIAAAAGARVISIPNNGVSRARNHGIDEARGEWIAFLDADDRWLPERLERQAAAQKLVPEAHFIFCDMRRERAGSVVEPRWMVDRTVYKVTPKYQVAEFIVAFDGRELAHHILEENYIPTSSVLVYRDAIPSGGFNPRLKYCEDLELWLRILASHDAAAIEEPLVAYRLHESSASAHWESILRGDIALYQRIVKHASGYTPSLDRRAQALLAPRTRALGEHLVRTESYTKACAALFTSFRRRPSLRTIAWLGIALCLSAPGIRPLHQMLRRRKNI